MNRIRVTYEGRVQGVGFRATTRSIASRLDVSGWVRNEPDGTVTMEAQGAQAELDRLLDEVRVKMGKLIRAERRADLDPLDAEDGFEVRR